MTTPEAAVRHAVASARLAGIDLDPEHQALLAEVADGTISGDAAVARVLGPGPQVKVSPSMRFGRPHMNGINTEMIADLYWLGEDVEDEYDLSRHELLVALWFEGTYGAPRYRKRWKAWARTAGDLLWKSDTVDVQAVPLPPTKTATRP